MWISCVMLGFFLPYSLLPVTPLLHFQLSIKFYRRLGYALQVTHHWRFWSDQGC